MSKLNVFKYIYQKSRKNIMLLDVAKVNNNKISKIEAGANTSFFHLNYQFKKHSNYKNTLKGKLNFS